MPLPSTRACAAKRISAEAVERRVLADGSRSLALPRLPGDVRESRKGHTCRLGRYVARSSDMIGKVPFRVATLYSGAHLPELVSLDVQ
jgi:hypothetical protein